MGDRGEAAAVRADAAGIGPTGHLRPAVHTRRLFRALTAVLAGAVLFTSVSGCGPGHEPGPRPHRDAALPPAPTPDQKTRLLEVENELTRRCMEGKGFAYVPVRPAVGSADREPPDFTFGSDDVTWAKKHGFALREAEEQSRIQAERMRDNPNARIYQRLSTVRKKAYTKALDGTGTARATADVPGVGRVFTNTDGCQARARAQLYGDLARWGRVHTLATNLDALAVPRVLRDAEYREALAGWRACITDATGHRYASPSAAQQAVSDRYTGEEAPGGSDRRFEYDTALASARCARTTHLTATGQRLRRSYLAEVTRENHADLLLYRRLVATALDRAPSLLADPPDHARPAN